MRVLIAVTHLLGAGHLTRAAALARALAAEGHAVVLASGGNPAPLVRLDGVRLLQLDPVHIRGTAFSDLLDREGRPAGAALLARRRDALLGALSDLAPDAVVLGADAPRLPNTSCFGLSGVTASTLLMGLDLGGIAVSSGSACSSGRIGRSPILDAMGVAPHIGSVVRVSFGWNSRPGDETVLLDALERSLGRIRPVRAA